MVTERSGHGRLGGRGPNPTAAGGAAAAAPRPRTAAVSASTRWRSAVLGHRLAAGVEQQHDGRRHPATQLLQHAGDPVAARAARDRARCASRVHRSRAWSCSARASAIRRAMARNGVRNGTSSSGRPCAEQAATSGSGVTTDHLGAEAERSHADRDESLHVVVVRARRRVLSELGAGGEQQVVRPRGRASDRADPSCAPSRSRCPREPASSRSPSRGLGQQGGQADGHASTAYRPVVPDLAERLPFWQCLAGLPSAASDRTRRSLSCPSYHENRHSVDPACPRNAGW